MDLYSILACPLCKGDLERRQASLECRSCGRAYPIVDGVPVLLPDGSIPVTEHQHNLVVQQEYGLWIPRLVMKSLPASAIMLDLGAGNQALDLPNVVRMDVTLTPYTDVVGDAHALPFRSGVFDFIVSLAVLEHLRQPFLAAQEMFDALRNGGYVYGDCNFIFAYHGFPHHYFNATQQGLEQVFGRFSNLRSGVAPNEMPSFALELVLTTYLRVMSESSDPEVMAYKSHIQELLDQPLRKYDALFTEEAALMVAAGVYCFGRKVVEGPSEVIPPAIQAVWEQDETLKSRFPDLFNLGTGNNIMLWARDEGRQKHSTIEEYFQSVAPFRKNESVGEEGQRFLDSTPAFEPLFCAIPDTREGDLVAKKEEHERLVQSVADLTEQVNLKNRHIARLESLLKEIESGRVMRLLRFLDRKKP